MMTLRVDSVGHAPDRLLPLLRARSPLDPPATAGRRRVSYSREREQNFKFPLAFPWNDRIWDDFLLMLTLKTNKSLA